MPLGKPWAQVCATAPAARPECVTLVSSRVGQRGSGLSMSAARSEHEVSEIIDGLSEQEVRPRPRDGGGGLSRKRCSPRC